MLSKVHYKSNKYIKKYQPFWSSVNLKGEDALFNSLKLATCKNDE